MISSRISSATSTRRLRTSAKRARSISARRSPRSCGSTRSGPDASWKASDGGRSRRPARGAMGGACRLVRGRRLPPRWSSRLCGGGASGGCEGPCLGGRRRAGDDIRVGRRGLRASRSDRRPGRRDRTAPRSGGPGTTPRPPRARIAKRRRRGRPQQPGRGYRAAGRDGTDGRGRRRARRSAVPRGRTS